MLSELTWFERSSAVIPGGVNSPARSFRSVGGDPPLVMVGGEGAYLIDVEGRRYIDYLAAFGPVILGHAHPEVTEAIQQAALEGTLLGTPHPNEIRLAEMLVDAVEGLDMVRLTTTGTEAVMSTIRLARAFTGRNLVIKFEGTYHGHSDGVLVKAGSGAATVGTADSLGVPEGVTGDVISLPFNDVERLKAILNQLGDRVACVLVEPVVGNMGIVMPRPGYLKTLLELAHRVGALVIFDEVITGFRFHYGSVASLLGVVPDLYALGKIIGGGLPQGAYGGRRDIMQYVSPLGGMFQAGTLAGNPLSCAAGLRTLEVLRQEDPYPQMAALAERLESGIRDSAQRHSIPITINRMGGAFTVFFGPQPVWDYDTASAASKERFGLFHQAMLSQGVYLAPSRFEAWFVSAAHQSRDIERTLEAVDVAMGRLHS